MATYLENITTRRETIATQLAAITAGGSMAGGLPTNTGDGNHPQHDQHVDRLYRELAQLDKLIDDEKSRNAGDAGNPGFVESYVIP